MKPERLLPVFFVLFLAFTGCAVLDSITGITPDSDGDGVPEIDGTGGTAGAIGSVLGGFPGVLGLLGTVLGSGAAIYQRVRAKKYLAAAKSTVRGIDKALDKGKNLKISKDELYSALLSERAGDKYSEFIKDLVATLKKNRREE
jgi:hypothetical protein